jgi:hypothetical protein
MVPQPTRWDAANVVARSARVQPPVAGAAAGLLMTAVALVVVAACGSSSAPSNTPVATVSASPSSTPAPTLSPSPTPASTTVTISATPPVTVSIPSGWTPQPVVGDGSRVTIDGPDGAVIGFTHPTAGSYTITSCEQSAPSDVPGYIASGSQPITIDGSATTEYAVPDKGLLSYAASTYVTGGVCWTATAQPGTAPLDHAVVDMIFESVKYGSS